ncbi:hypothetical protein [Endozoicomonas sp. 4G]|uniref:hypothetical protein n=1 Tax=Endozoicomonas sp. 4G TaxID=2872754 RepID=UPI002078E55A|nr:hypothetical protein [Endozoicomonas sp. 4G]
MKAPGKRILVFSYLLFICSVAHSGVSKEEQFHLLSHYSNTPLVKDSLKLVTSSSGLAVSALINYGLWYSICKAPGVVAALTGRFAGTEQNELQEVKSSFCNQLAAVLTSTEIALAGHVSPWPLETPWWQPLRFVGTAYGGYVAYKTESDPYRTPIITAVFFTNDVVTRTVAGGAVIFELRYKDKSTIQPFDYARTEYSVLSFIAAMMVGTIVYEQLIARDYRPSQAAFAYMISYVLAEQISAISPLSRHDSGSVEKVRTGAEGLAGAGALAGSLATATSGAASVAYLSSSAVARAVAVACAVKTVIYTRQNLAGVGMFAGMVVGNAALVVLDQQRSELESNHILRNVALTLVPALALAVINGVSNNAVYGYSLEESFTETARTQWQKFYAPLNYLRTLFN